jgi:hypothetical protein
VEIVGATDDPTKSVKVGTWGKRYMCSIYLINVGANTKHESQARSPIFNDGSFVYVSYVADREKEMQYTKYPNEMIPFTNPRKDNLVTHNDPDWGNLTYGDDCSNPRAGALKRVTPGDILLFWGLLWHNNCSDWISYIGKNGSCWNNFTDEKGWYLLGALRVGKIVKGKQDINNLAPADRCRALKNAHCLNGDIARGHRIFLGEMNQSHSGLFERAVDLQVEIQDSGLVYQAFRAADGRHLSLNGTPRLFSSLRACRKMWDLEQYRRAEIVRDAIQKVNKDFDLLEDA